MPDDPRNIFPLAAVLGITTGVAWGPFSDVHALAEHVMGHPIWTHEFASKPLWEEMRRRVLVAYPWLAAIDSADFPTSEADCADRLAAQVARFGGALLIPAGSDVRTKSPIETATEAFGAKRVVVVRGE